MTPVPDHDETDGPAVGLARGCGVASAAVLAVAVAGALALDPTVPALPVRARLSDLGRPGAPGALLLDGGFLLAGVLGLVLARGLWRGAERAADPATARAVAALAGGAHAALAGAGLFPLPSPAHTPLLATIYLATAGTVALDGLRLRAEGGAGAARRRGTTLLGVVGVVTALWGVRAVVGSTFLVKAPTAVSLPAELATLALLAGWTFGRGRSLRRA